MGLLCIGLGLIDVLTAANGVDCVRESWTGLTVVRFAGMWDWLEIVLHIRNHVVHSIVGYFGTLSVVYVMPTPAM